MLSWKIKKWPRSFRLQFCGLLLLYVFFFLLPEAHAQAATSFLDKMIDTYQSKTMAWEGILRNFALRLFWILAAIEFSWNAIKLALKGADFTDFLAEILNRVLYIGFFLTLLLNSSTWSQAIIDSFRQAGSAASTAAGGTGVITPSDVLNVGLSITQQVFENISVVDIGDSIALALAGIVIMIAFALMIALLVIALVESYFVTTSSVLLIGFGGSNWTSQFAINTLRYTVSVGAKLFMVQLVIGVGQAILNDWVTQAQTGNFTLEEVAAITTISIVFLAITKVIPDMVQALINGSSLATGAALSGMAGQAVGSMAAVAAGVASGGISSAAGAGVAAHGAYSLASEKLKSTSSSQGQPGSPALTGEAIKSTASHFMKTVGQRFTGEINTRGNLGGQVGSSMRQEAAKIRALREEPGQGQNSSGNDNSSNNHKNANRLYPED